MGSRPTKSRYAGNPPHEPCQPDSGDSRLRTWAQPEYYGAVKAVAVKASASYPAEVRGLTNSRRLGLAAASAILFVAALALSWTEGADHLTLQLLAMVIALIAFLLAAVAARSKPSHSG